MAAGLEAARSSSPSLEDLEAAAQTDIVERAPFITSIQPEAQSQPSDRGPSAAPPGQIEPPVNLDRRQSIVVTEHAGAEMLRRFRSEDLVLDAERRSSSWRERSRSRSLAERISRARLSRAPTVRVLDVVACINNGRTRTREEIDCGRQKEMA